MGRFSLLIICVLLLGSCSLVEEDTSNSAALEHGLYGTWRWVYSDYWPSGTFTPSSRGYTRRLEISPDDTLRTYRSDSLVRSFAFRVEHEGEEGKAPRYAIYAADRDDVPVFLFYEPVVGDTLELHCPGKRCDESGRDVFVRARF